MAKQPFLRLARLHESQVNRLQQAVKSEFGCNLQEVDAADWAPIIREIYVVVQAKGDTGRIDSFNRTYGLMRGVTAALGLLAIIALLITWPAWKPPAFVAIAYLLDVFALPSHRNLGYGSRLIEHILDFPDFVDVKKWTLKTRDSRSLYERHGFIAVDSPDGLMVLSR